MQKKTTTNLQKLFFPYQRKWIRDKSLRKLADKSRQVGFSWTEAFTSTVELANGDWDVFITTRDEELAKQFVEDCRKWAKMIGAVAELDTDLVEKDVISRLKFSSGKSISVISSSPTAVIGRRGKIIIDEFGDHKDQKKLFESAEPCTTWGFPLVIYSAHYHGKGTFFAELVRKHEEYGFSYHRVTFEQAVAEGLLDRILEKAGRVEVGGFRMGYEGRKTTKDEHRAYCDAKRKSVGNKIYEQAYMCVPSDEDGQFITLALYEPCERSGILLDYRQLLDCKGDLYAGFDFARYAHLSVIWVVERLGLQLITRHVLTMEKKPTPYQNQRLDELMSIPNLRRVCIDRTGPGIGVTDYAIDKHGSFRVEGVNFTAPVKETLSHRGKQFLEERSLVVPDNPVYRADFMSLQKTVTAAGNIRIDSTENEENPASHADHFWACMLALEAAAGTPLGKPQVTTLSAETRTAATTRPGRLQQLLKGFKRS
jgi:phage FluMu gp28-like protein